MSAKRFQGKAARGSVHVKTAGIGNVTLLLGNAGDVWSARAAVTLSHVEVRALINVLNQTIAKDQSEM
jgi:hypothetical protein